MGLRVLQKRTHLSEPGLGIGTPFAGIAHQLERCGTPGQHVIMAAIPQPNQITHDCQGDMGGKLRRGVKFSLPDHAVGDDVGFRLDPCAHARQSFR